MTTLINIENVNVKFGNKTVLKEINFSVEAGEFIGIIGPNAAGKTTLVKTILGLIKPASGNITVLNSSPNLVRHRIGYVSQKPEINSQFPITVKDAVMLGRFGNDNSFGTYTVEDKNITEEILQILNITNIATYKLTDLSGGQLQRVWLARALVCQPEILILDEPTANIDVIAEENIFKLLKNYNSKMTILVISHDVAFISSYVDRVACVNQNLICHDIESINGKSIEELYGIDVSMIHHHHTH